MSEFCNSLISLEILNILNGNCNENTKIYSDQNLEQYFDGLLFNWELMQSLFPQNLFSESNLCFSHSNCLQYVNILRPIWLETVKILEKHSEKDKDLIMTNLQWTGSANVIKDILYQAKTEINILEGLLLLTSIIENTLGNVYYTVTGKSPPHLLRDLLHTEELHEIFGKFVIFFLQLLMGTPNSVNIRNIVWHGFPTPGEIPEYYYSLLVITIINLGDILKKKQFQVKCREKVQNLQYYFQLIEIKNRNNFQDFEIIRNSDLILENYKTIWKQIYKSFAKCNYRSFIILILPQIEVILRLMYQKLNDYDVKAKLNEYYIIIDTIFEENVPTKHGITNKIYSYLDNGTLKLLYDLFISPNGPRIRDKISHGEVDFDAITETICSIIFYLALNLINSDNFQLTDYESKFHPNCKAFDNIKNLRYSIEKLKDINPPDIMNYNIEWNCIKVNNILDFSEMKNIKIFFRPKREFELINLLIKVVNCINISCKNLINSFQQRFQLLINRELRSKRRKTLENMLKSLPNIFDTLTATVESLEIIFVRLQTDQTDILELHMGPAIKMGKRLLKFVENLAKYCEVSNNEWDKALKVCCDIKILLDAITNNMKVK